MCGFVGFVNQPNVQGNTIRKMAYMIKHRGPDDQQFYQNKDVNIGFRRLSMIDLLHGSQPLFSEDRSKVLTFNGEIYNYKLLRKPLKKLGYKFMTDVDSEVIMRGYEAWGTKVFNKLKGMFATVIYDSKYGPKHNESAVIGAVDPIGVKPLYIYDDGKTFLWGSEIKSFLKHPNFKKELNTKLLPIHFSFDYIPSRETLFKHVYKIMPGQYFIHHIKSGKTELHYYYKFNFNHINNKMTLKQATKKIQQLVSHSVDTHLISSPKVKIGSYLSEGVDSSYILDEEAKHRPVHSFTLGYNHSKYSEITPAKKFANSIHQKNTDIVMKHSDFFDLIPTLMYINDVPNSNAAEAQAYLLANVARKHVKGVTSGEGIDELLGGYNTFYDYKTIDKYKKRVPKWLRKILAKTASHLPRFHGRRLLMRGNQPLWENYYRINYLFDNHDKNKLFKGTGIKNIDAGKYTKPVFDQVKDKDPLTQEQYFDVKYWLPFNLLHQADRTSMYNSIELRTPYLDKDFVQFCATIPPKLRYHNGINKYVWRKAANGVLPKSVTQRPKLGFPSPLASIMKQPKYHKMIMKAFTSDIAHKFFNVKYLKHLVKQHDKGHSYMKQIYALYCFIVWYSIYFPENTKTDYRKYIKSPEFA